jgi:hypothetical protein
VKNGAERGNVWSIVLAGGDGVRTKEFIRRWLGHEKPKQYCTFVGSRSMFQHTLDRTDRLTPWERVVVVALSTINKKSGTSSMAGQPVWFYFSQRTWTQRPAFFYRSRLPCCVIHWQPW